MSMNLINEWMKTFGEQFKPDLAETFRLYMELILAENKKQNLTRITEEEDVVILHFLDSLAALPFIPREARTADIGSGAGLPGIPLLIARPSLHMYLVEAQGKKAAFLRAAISRLGLSGAEVLCCRAEEIGRNPAYRESMDVVVTRAVAALPVLLELGLPLLKAGGKLLAYKGPEGCKEVTDAREAALRLGGDGGVVHSIDLPMGKGERTIIEIKKIAPTPEKYPRRPGMPQKHPIKGKKTMPSK